ncbi:hypothetical protein IC620_16410 [Hazenella sp. IB182357]|uniref:Uncharacterized protein n=1 Tax=Polycladospora coralii TaxID=2771432 RepID=A0A926NC69_9BACL|nr:hypothetical protein [Polycladospora coralii]MBD1373928.1 hypothetical protein [Polycladospora coralii]MBS7532000.1 hypothetical protein [Polycladospora coralii]
MADQIDHRYGGSRLGRYGEELDKWKGVHHTPMPENSNLLIIDFTLLPHNILTH